MAERVTVEATGQARIEGEPTVTLYRGGVYPFRTTPDEAYFLLRHTELVESMHAFVDLDPATMT